MNQLPDAIPADIELWRPSSEVIANANLTHYMEWLGAHKGIHCANYSELWAWSVEHIEDFWESLWAYFDLKASAPWTTPLVKRTMPGAQWFVGARLNYAENIFARKRNDQPMMFYKTEDRPLVELGWS